MSWKPVKCPCAHKSCDSWLIEPVAWVQGVSFTREEAMLVCAAPDLLAACKEFVAKCDRGEARSTRSYAQMVAAIRKAEASE